MAIWLLDEDDQSAFEEIMRAERLPSRIATLRWLMQRASRGASRKN